MRLMSFEYLTYDHTLQLHLPPSHIVDSLKWTQSLNSWTAAIPMQAFAILPVTHSQVVLLVQNHLPNDLEIHTQVSYTGTNVFTGNLRPVASRIIAHHSVVLRPQQKYVGASCRVLIVCWVTQIMTSGG